MFSMDNHQLFVYSSEIEKKIVQYDPKTLFWHALLRIYVTLNTLDSLKLQQELCLPQRIVKVLIAHRWEFVRFCANWKPLRINYTINFLDFSPDTKLTLSYFESLQSDCLKYDLFRYPKTYHVNFVYYQCVVDFEELKLCLTCIDKKKTTGFKKVITFHRIFYYYNFKRDVLMNPNYWCYVCMTTPLFYVKFKPKIEYESDGTEDEIEQPHKKFKSFTKKVTNTYACNC